MKNTSKLLILLSVTTLVAGCKLAVIVVEGGQVQSTSSGTCLASTVCIVDVSDPNFTETFTAIPSEGWYFQKWNSGERLFCEGSADPTCALSFQGYEVNPQIQEIIESSEVFYLMPVFRQIHSDIIAVDGRTVIIDGKEWLQPVDFVNYSFLEVLLLCPNRVCSGTLPGSMIDLTGFTWASSEDVQSLFNIYQGVGSAMLEDFEYTMTEKDEFGREVNRTLHAMLSDSAVRYGGPIIIATVHDRPPIGSGEEERSIYQSPITESNVDTDVGVWFWKSVR